MQKKYDTYKDSGIEWIGEVPSHWEILSIKHCISIAKGTKPKDLTDENTGFPYLTMDYLRSRDGKTTMYPTSTEGLDLIDDNEILVLWDGANAGEYLLSKKGYIGSTMAKISVDSSMYDKVYFYLLMKAIEQVSKDYANGTTIPHFDNTVLTDYNYPCPPLFEQRAIAEFLKEKCGKVDELIANLEQQEKDLSAMKKSEISRVVTKGLNPNAPLKDSGIEWIEKMPEHWDVKRLRYMGHTQNGLSKDGSYFGSGYPFVTYGDVYNNIILPTVGSGLAKSTESDQQLYSVERGDVFFTRTSETIEEIGYCSTCLKTIPQATFSGFLIRFRPDNDDLLPEFSAYYFRSDLHRRFFVKEMNSVTRASLSQNLLKNLPILLPPKDEQNQIAVYLDSYCQKVDKTILEIKEQIADLKLYKQSLISEAVTGKIKVTD